jgi:hypothetical protein
LAKVDALLEAVSIGSPSSGTIRYSLIEPVERMDSRLFEILRVET